MCVSLFALVHVWMCDKYYVSLIVPSLTLCSTAITVTAQLASDYLSLSHTQKYKYRNTQKYTHCIVCIPLPSWNCYFGNQTDREEIQLWNWLPLSNNKSVFMFCIPEKTSKRTQAHIPLCKWTSKTHWQTRLIMWQGHRAWTRIQQ